MTYDPAWDMPQENWQQQGSFETPQTPLAVDPDSGTPVCVGPFAFEWLPYILGAMDQLRNPSSWKATSDDDMYAVLNRANRLRQIFSLASACPGAEMLRFTDTCELQSSTDGITWTTVAGWDENFALCVQAHTPITGPPPNPGGKTPDQMACAIATFLTEQILQPSIQKGIDNFLLNNNLLQYALDISLTLPGFEWTSLFLEGVSVLYNVYSYANISDFESAMTSTVLWGKVRCAMYSAIAASGKITAANFPTILTNLAAITYSSAAVVSAIHDYVQALGFVGLAELSQAAGLDPNVFCGACAGSGTWCHTWNFADGPGPFTVFPSYHAVYVPGVGWQSQVVGGSYSEVAIQVVWSPATMVQHMDICIVAPDPDGSAQRRYFVQNPPGTPVDDHGLSGATFGLPCGNPGNWDPISHSVTQAGVIFRSASPTGPAIIKSLKLAGDGVNPFGYDNCSR